MLSPKFDPNQEPGPFAQHALTVFDAGLGEVFPVLQSTKMPRSWDKPADDWEWGDRKPDGKRHTVTARNHPPIERGRVADWATRYPADMLGLIPAPNVVSLDIDQHDEKHGAENLAAALGLTLKGLSRLLRGTLHVTGRERGTGWERAHGHWYFTVPEGTPFVRLLEGVADVEVVGPGRQGYYVVAPGSVHEETGKVYRADVSGFEVAVADLSLDLIRPMPQPLLDLLLQSASERAERPSSGGSVQEAEQYANDPWGEPSEAVQSVLDEYLDDYGDFEDQGTHHDSMKRVQLRLIHLADQGEPGVWTALSEAEAAYKGYRDNGDWERALEGADVNTERMKYASETGDWDYWGYYAPEATLLRDPVTGEPVKQLRQSAEERFWNSRPVLRRMRAFARARRVAPWALLGCVLARVGASVPPEVVLPPLVGSDGSLNSFFALCGDSGTGKSSTMNAAEDFLVIEGGIEFEKTGVGSGEGLIASYVHTEGGTKTDPDVRQVQHNRSTLYVVDEVQGLGALSSRTASTLVPFLKTAWVGSMLATQNASRDTNRKVGTHEYRLNIVAGVQPEHAEVILADVGGGFPQRWVWLPTYDPDRPAWNTEVEEPEPYVWRVPDPTYDPREPIEKPLSAPGGRYRMEVPAVVREAVYAAQDANNRPIGEKAVGETLDGHAVFAREKVAALLALLDGRLSMSVEDWLLSGYIAEKSDETRSAVMQAHASEAARQADQKAKRAGRSTAIAKESEAEAATLRIARKLREKFEKAKASGDEWISGAVLRKSLRSSDRDHFEAAIERLLEGSGEIEAREVEGTGQNGVQYRLK